jgi:hypothetical protein
VSQHGNSNGFKTHHALSAVCPLNKLPKRSGQLLLPFKRLLFLREAIQLLNELNLETFKLLNDLTDYLLRESCDKVLSF